MLTDKIKELEVAKAKVQELEQKIVSERPQELAGLPGRYGFDSVNAFLKAVKEAVAAVGAAPRRGRKSKKAAAAAPKKVKKARTRARITDETKVQVKEMVLAGKSGAEIASKLGISLPSVQNIKKALGLVKARGAEAPAAPATPAS